MATGIDTPSVLRQERAMASTRMDRPCEALGDKSLLTRQPTLERLLDGLQGMEVYTMKMRYNMGERVWFYEGNILCRGEIFGKKEHRYLLHYHGEIKVKHRKELYPTEEAALAAIPR